MTAIAWNSVIRARVRSYTYAAWAASSYNSWLSASIDRQAHSALCRELRDLAARISLDSTR